MKKFVLIFIVVFLAYGLTSFMYYGQDDHSLIFKLQHLDEGVGQYGEGITGKKSSSPYRYMVVPFVPIYYFFGTNPLPYFIIGVFNYYLASLSVYFVARILTNNKKAGLISGLIFASGFFGSDSMLRITNSYENPHAIIFMCLTIAFYSLHQKKKNWWFYLLSLLMYAVTIEGFWIRTPGMIFLIIGLEILYTSNIIKSVIKLTPFSYLYYLLYIKGSPAAHEITNYLKLIFIDGKYTFLSVPIKSLSNMFLPDVFLPKENFIIPFIICALLFFVLVKLKNKVLWYAILFIVVNFMVYLAHFPERVIFSTHRYATIPFAGAAIFWGALLGDKYWIKKRWITLLSIVLIITINLFLTNKYLIWNIKYRNIPTRKFNQTLLKEIPQLPKGSALYFDIREDGNSRFTFNEFFGVGNMPNMTAIAWLYGIDRYDLYLPEEFDEVLSLVKSGKVDKNNVFTFFFDSQNFLKNTSNNTKAYLFEGKTAEYKFNTNTDLNLNYTSPMELTLDLNTRINQNIIGENVKPDLSVEKYISFLRSINLYYQTSSVSSSSEWKYYETRNALDRDLNTSWMSDRMEWHDLKKSELIVDLKSPRLIGIAKVSFSSPQRVPTKYHYECSVDKVGWQLLESENVQVGETQGYLKSKFKPILCRYVKFVITGVYMDDSPQVAEIGIYDSQFSDIDLTLAEAIETNPYPYLKNQSDMDKVNTFFNEIGMPIKICFETDKNNFSGSTCVAIKISPYQAKKYKIIVPVSGTLLKSFKIVSPQEIEVKVNSATFKPLTYQEIVNRGLIKDYLQTY